MVKSEIIQNVQKCNCNQSNKKKSLFQKMDLSATTESDTVKIQVKEGVHQ